MRILKRIYHALFTCRTLLSGNNEKFSELDDKLVNRIIDLYEKGLYRVERRLCCLRFTNIKDGKFIDIWTSNKFYDYAYIREYSLSGKITDSVMYDDHGSVHSDTKARVLKIENELKNKLEKEKKYNDLKKLKSFIE